MEFENKIYAVQDKWDDTIDIVRVVHTGKKPSIKYTDEFTVTIVGTIKPQTEWEERNYHIMIVNTDDMPVAFLWDCYNIYQYEEAYTREIASTNY